MKKILILLLLLISPNISYGNEVINSKPIPKTEAEVIALKEFLVNNLNDKYQKSLTQLDKIYNNSNKFKNKDCRPFIPCSNLKKLYENYKNKLNQAHKKNLALVDKEMEFLLSSL